MTPEAPPGEPPAPAEAGTVGAKGSVGSLEPGLLDSVVANIRQPLLLLDDDMRVLWATRSFYAAFDAAPEGTVGLPLAEAAGARLDGPALRDFLLLVRAGGGFVDEYPIEIVKPGSGRRMLLLSASAIAETPGAGRRMLVTIADVTRRRLAEEALEAARMQAELANAAKSRFLEAASHDLRQPLQAIGLLLGLLAKKVGSDEGAALVEKLGETLEAMAGMLNTLLDINQLEAGVVTPERVDFPIDDLLEHLDSEFGYYAEVHGLRWRMVRSGLIARSDPRLLEQMLRNLLSNAVKYTGQGGILLGCRRRGDALRVEVWDTGVGIPEEQLDAIFQAFHQLDNPARERSRGLGLGLAIVQRLGELLGHAIHVRSRPGRGSVFAIEVPLGQDQPAEARPTPGQKAVARRAGTILIIDDDRSVREMLDMLLRGEGHRTAVAADGAEALDLVARGALAPDIVIADYNLPGGASGLDTVARLRRTLARDPAVVMLTGDISAGTLRQIARMNCIQLNKPAGAPELSQVVQLLLDGARRPPAGGRAKAPEEDARPATVFVIDDDAAVRAAMQETIRAAGRPVEAYGTCEAFLAAFRPEHSGVLVVDARMPGMGGIALLEHLRAAGHRVPAIMMTGYGDVATAVHAMKAGALDFIEKPVVAVELLALLDRALEQAPDDEDESARRDAAVARMSGLTARERQVMDLVVAGNANKAIAGILGISQRTVENHRATVMRKIGAASLSELIQVALAAASPGVPGSRRRSD